MITVGEKTRGKTSDTKIKVVIMNMFRYEHIKEVKIT